MFWTRISLLLTGVLLVVARPQLHDEEEPPKCGYESCHPVKPGMLNVHIVPHTHDDVGWLKTVDQYYYGTKSRIQQASVQYILDSVIQELLTDPSKRFIYVETAFFWKWWKQQHDTLKAKVRRLVNRGQLEFIGGAWSMNDEAATHYQSTIDQFAWGLRKLNETFGECGRPKIGWQIDPFGHSREMASIFAQLGFDGLLFGRLDYQDKDMRLQTKTAEMVWKASASLGKSAELFTSVLYNNYSPPPGFCFDVLCGDDPIIDDKKSPEYNIDVKVAGFLYFAQKQARHYVTNNVILTMGGDFTYMDAHMWYKSLDKIIRHANGLQKDGSNINLLYSTPSCYLKAVHDEDKTRKWPVKSDDFFPYASDPHAYWTGYFTSKPTLKRYERMGNNFLQVCKQLYSLADLGPEDWVDLNAMREAMGVMQHHDAITGTEKEHVAHDYARILSHGFDECEIITKTALNKLMTPTKAEMYDIPKLSMNVCTLANISQCEATEKSNTFVVTVYNPLSRIVSQYVRLPVTGASYTVTDPNGVKVEVQLVPIPDQVQNIPGRESAAKHELVFRAGDIPPLGYKSYYVALAAGEIRYAPVSYKRKHYLRNGKLRMMIDRQSNHLVHIETDDIKLNIYQDFLYYRGCVGNNAEFNNRSSGAYIFRPNGTEAIPVSKMPTVQTYKGPLVNEIHQTFNDWVSQVIRTYGGENHIELEWLVGPIPLNDHVGKEVISRFSTHLKTNGTFYTDSNGREMLKRVKNYRPTWNLETVEPVAGNYYPVTSKIMIRDSEQEVAVLTDRAQGGSSLNDGEIELMVHRRLLHDDAFGVGEALNEEAFGTGLVARGQHYVVVGNTDKIAEVEKDIAQRKLLSAWTFISPVQMSYEDYKSSYRMEFAGIKEALPKNVQILTLEPWKAASFLLRLEHIYEKDEDPNLSKPVTIDVQDLFTAFTISSIRETTLGANQWLSENERLEWQLGTPLEDYKNTRYSSDEYDYYGLIKETNEIPKRRYADEKYARPAGEPDKCTRRLLEGTSVTLQPMQIRTFVINITKKTNFRY